MTVDVVLDLMRLPYAENGRARDGAVDCVGVTLELARRRGLVLFDPWDRVSDLFALGLDVDHLFPPGWVLAAPPLRDDDVVLLRDNDRLGAGYVLDGYIVTAVRGIGVLRLKASRVRPCQVWRFEP